MEKIGKEEINKLMKLKGMTKGSEIITLLRYIELKHGKEGALLLEKKLEELGHPIRFDEIEPALWYPESWNVLGMIIAKEIFNWKDLFDFGYNSSVFSFGIKVFIKFLPLPLFIKQIPEFWKKFLDVGELEGFICKEEKNCVGVRLKNYKYHPDMCLYYAGFFLKIAGYIIGDKKRTIKETKCIFRGDPYHEYLIKWI